jgi:hypothetical protein
MTSLEQHTRKRHHSNGEGSLRHRPKDGLWEARITVEGTRRSHYAHTRTKASRWLAEQRRNRDHGLPVALNERTCLAAYLADWLARVEPRLRPSAHRRYQELAGHLTRHLGTVPLAKLTPCQWRRGNDPGVTEKRDPPLVGVAWVNFGRHEERARSADEN